MDFFAFHLLSRLGSSRSLHEAYIFMACVAEAKFVADLQNYKGTKVHRSESSERKGGATTDKTDIILTMAHFFFSPL